MSYCQRPPAKSALLLAGLTLLLLPDSHALSTLQVGRSTSTSQEGGGDGRAACTGEGPLELHPANEAKCYLGKEGLPGNRTFGVSVQEEGFLNFKGSKRTGPKLEPYEVIGAAMLNASASPPIINLSSLAADANLTYCSDGDFLQLSAPSQSITVDIIRADCPETPVETPVSLLREGERQQRQRLSVKRLDFTPEDCGSSIGVTVKVFTDEYPRETRWEIRNDAGVVVAESGNYYYSSELTLYEDTIMVPPGALTFTLFDSFGDGLCCGYGPGYYIVSVHGQEFGRGAVFGSFHTTSFFVDLPTEVRHCFCFENYLNASSFATDYAVAGGALVHNSSSSTYKGWKRFRESNKCQTKRLNARTCLCCEEPGAFAELPYCFKAPAAPAEDNSRNSSNSSSSSFLGTHTVWNDAVTEMVRCDPLNHVETTLLGCV